MSETTDAQREPNEQPTVLAASRATMFSFTYPLRNGGSVTFAPPELRVANGPGAPAERYALNDLAAATLAADTTVPGAPGAPPTPAVALRLNDGRVVGFTPVNPLDCWTLLEAIYRVRPQLLTPLPPRPGAGYAAPPSPGAGYAPPPPPGAGYAPPSPGYASAYPPPPLPNVQQNNEHVLAGLAHLSIFFGALIVPLIIWLTTTRSSPYASRQAKQAFLFHCAVTVVDLILTFAWLFIFFAFFGLGVASSASNPSNPTPFAGAFIFFPLFYLILLVVSLGSIILGVYAAVQAFQGRPYHYPGLGRF